MKSKFYTMNQIITQGLLKKPDGTPYSDTQAMKYLLHESGIKNDLYFPKAEQKIDVHGRPYWQFAQEDIDLFNKHNHR